LNNTDKCYYTTCALGAKQLTANISDAKIKTSAKKIDLDRGCLEQTAQQSQVYDISTSDIRGICQMITKYYTDANKLSQKSQDNCTQSNYCDDGREYETRGFEVKKIKLEWYNKDQATIRIEMTNRLYNWSNKKWILLDAKLVAFRVSFIKKNGTWFYNEKEFLY
jgi:hypothetical protein